MRDPGGGGRTLQPVARDPDGPRRAALAAYRGPGRPREGRGRCSRRGRSVGGMREAAGCWSATERGGTTGTHARNCAAGEAAGPKGHAGQCTPQQRERGEGGSGGLTGGGRGGCGGRGGAGAAVSGASPYRDAKRSSAISAMASGSPSSAKTRSTTTRSRPILCGQALCQKDFYCDGVLLPKLGP